MRLKIAREPLKLPLRLVVRKSDGKRKAEAYMLQCRSSNSYVCALNEGHSLDYIALMKECMRRCAEGELSSPSQAREWCRGKYQVE